MVQEIKHLKRNLFGVLALVTNRRFMWYGTITVQ